MDKPAPLSRRRLLKFGALAGLALPLQASAGQNPPKVWRARTEEGKWVKPMLFSGIHVYVAKAACPREGWIEVYVPRDAPWYGRPGCRVLADFKKRCFVTKIIHVPHYIVDIHTGRILDSSLGSVTS